MSEEKLLDKLINIGLKKNEAIVYMNLITQDSYCASDLARISEISRTTIYKILNSLIEKGLCREIIGSVNHYKAVEPIKAFKIILKNIKEQEEMTKKLSNVLRIIYNDRNNNDSVINEIELIKTKQSIRNKSIQLQKCAKSTIRIFLKKPFLFKRFREYLDKIPENIETYLLCEINDKDIIEDNFNCVEHENLKIKFVEELPMKLFIYDDHNLLLSLRDSNFNNKECLSLSLSNMPLASILIVYFNLLWKTEKI